MLGDDSVYFRIRTPARKEYVLLDEKAPEWTGAQLKEWIMQQTHIPVADQILSCAGKVCKSFSLQSWLMRRYSHGHI